MDVVIDSPHEPVDDQDATKALPERDLAFSGHFPRVSPERSGACAGARVLVLGNIVVVENEHAFTTQ